MSDPAKTPPVLLVTDKTSHNGKVWSDTAKNRFIKQHGSVDDIPEGDAHAVPVYNSPVQPPPVTPEEQKAAEEKLTEQINALKNQNTKPEEPVPAEKKGSNFYDEWVD